MTIDEIGDQFNRVAHEAQTLAFITRDRDLQEQARRTLADFLRHLAEQKQVRVEANEDDSANRLLALQLAIESLRAELAMYVDLKDNKPEEAWNNLIEAQDLARAAMRAHESAVHLKGHVAKLHYVEEIVFPPQVFMSIGSVVYREECSICRGDYKSCEHIAGRPYRGAMCSVICSDIEAREVSFVTEPADKRCRVTHFSENGSRRNKMTWRLE